MKKHISLFFLCIILQSQGAMAGFMQDCIDSMRQTARNLSYVVSGLSATAGTACLGAMGYLAAHRTPNSVSSAARVRSILQTLEDIGVPEVNANILQFDGRHLAALGITGTGCLVLAALLWPHSKKAQAAE